MRGACKRPHAARWRFVTLSSRLHGCRHLAGRNLCRRVLGVAAREHQEKGEVVTLATKELSSLAEPFAVQFQLRIGPRHGWRQQAAAPKLSNERPELEALEELSSELGLTQWESIR